MTQLFEFFPLFLDGEQKKEKKALGKTGSSRLEKGTEQAFIDLIAHILGRVTSSYRPFVDIYMIPSKIVHYNKWSFHRYGGSNARLT